MTLIRCTADAPLPGQRRRTNSTPRARAARKTAMTADTVRAPTKSRIQPKFPTQIHDCKGEINESDEHEVGRRLLSRTVAAMLPRTHGTLVERAERDRTGVHHHPRDRDGGLRPQS